MTQSVREQRQSENGSERESQIDLRGKKQMERERVTETTDKRTEQVYDQVHPQGATQSAFVKQQRRQEGEKTTEEKTEEEIVMEYIKKASLLEIYRQEEGQGCATGTVGQYQLYLECGTIIIPAYLKIREDNGDYC